MRFPYGRCDAKSLTAVADAGLLAIQWDLVTGDPDPHQSAKAIVNTILTRVHPGAIIVAHARNGSRFVAPSFASDASAAASRRGAKRSRIKPLCANRPIEEKP